MKPLDGKTALVTGCASETGCAIANKLAEAGAAICLCDALPDWIEPQAEAIRAAGGRAIAIAADLSQEAGVDQAVRRVNEAFGPVDLLVLNFAVWAGGLIHEHSVAAWDRALALNLRAPFLTARAVLPGMRARASGHIVTISSESALGTYERDGVYGVSMHALNALSAAIQLENEPAGIRVDTLCTGVAQSKAVPNALHPGDVADWVLWLFTRPAGLKTTGPILVQQRQ
jgi:3-hydroxybutyrate dehydrogenase